MEFHTREVKEMYHERAALSVAEQESLGVPSLVPPIEQMRRSMLAVLVERLQKTADNIQTIFFTGKYESGKRKKRKLVILGSGWASYAMIKMVDCSIWDIQVVSPRNYFLFTPLLASSSVGTVEFRSITEPIRQSNERVEYVEAECLYVDPTRKVLTCAPVHKAERNSRTLEVGYDQLVVAVGAQTGTFGVDGVQQHCHFLRGIDDAHRLRRAIVEIFEKANLDIYPEEQKRKLLSFVIVGGGPTGCEFAGELCDLVRNDLTRFFPLLVNLVSIRLLQSRSSILTEFDASLREQALANFQKSGVNVMSNSKVVRVTKDNIFLRDGAEIPFGLCVWAAGNAPTNIAENLVASIPDQAKRRGGRILVDDYLRVIGLKDVFAIGDCSEMASGDLPASAQVAVQQGAYLSRLLNKLARDKESSNIRSGSSARPFRFLSLGFLAYIGNNRALAQIKLHNRQLKLAGRFAFLLWRLVYLSKQVSTRNRVLVLADWLKTLFFGRDISQI
uniref:FAD/NAD(P)-binding domain-containing protein n=1 Tax=Compsopogon caeruleus TaxID=31354 RepID=A0A7S1TFN5_9RHOD